MATTDLLEPVAGVAIVRVESMPFGENTYIAHRAGAADCLVVDPGFEPDAIVSEMEARGLVPRAILLTHGHSDHIAGNAFLRDRWPDLPIMVGRGDSPKLLDPAGNLSAAFGVALASPPADHLLDDGQRLAIAGFEITVHDLPGHSAGHVVFLVEGLRPRFLFGGDVLFREGVGRTDFPDGDFAALASGIRRHIYGLPDDTIVLPGHGDPTTVGHERRHNPFVPGVEDD